MTENAPVKFVALGLSIQKCLWFLPVF